MKHLFLTTLIAFTSITFTSCNSNSGDTSVAITMDENSNFSLNGEWSFKRASDVPGSGEQISIGRVSETDWSKGTIPNTVMANLVEAGVYKDPYSFENMKSISKDSVLQDWYYLKTFSLPKGFDSKNYTLNFDGINYKMDVFLNGKTIAKDSAALGAFNTFSFDVNEALQEGENRLLVKLSPPLAGAYSIGFVDWAPTPPDKNMGIWRSVHLKVSDPVELRNTFVSSKFANRNYKEASLSISTELSNKSDEAQEITLEGVIGPVSFSKKVKLAAGESKTETITEKDIPQLLFKNPKLWWPVGYGAPNRYTLNLKAKIGENVSSSETVNFGIREVKDYKNENGHRGYIVNGKKVLIKGAGWVDKLFLENDSAYDEQQVQYVVDMNMNCIRFEGFWGKDHNIYDLCDKYGILAMVGFSCHWEWADYIGTPCGDQFGCAEEPEEIALLANYWNDQITYLRNHPSIYVWVGGSDFLPHPDLEKHYNDTLAKIDPTRPYLGAAKWHTSAVTGNTGVKMEGPYDYVTPNYWYTDTVRGGAFGFNTETGPGPQPPVLSSLKKMYGQNINFPVDSTWDFHHGRHAFGTMGKYLKAFNARYGESESLEDFALVSQMANYEAIRPMFESFRVNKPNTTGIVQWMLNSAWPETYWQLYDFYLQPTGAYYGTKIANEPIQTVYNYGNNKLYIVNEDKVGMLSTVKVKVDIINPFKNTHDSLSFEVESKSPMNHELDAKINVDDSLVFVFITTQIGDKKTVYNNYWLSKVPDVIDPDYSHSSWVYTPNLSFSDMSKLRQLPTAKVNVSTTETDKGKKVELRNESETVAFGIQLELMDNATNDLVMPAVWSDNYLVLQPNESRVVEVESNDQNNVVKINYLNK